MSLLEPRVVYKPFQYPWAYDFWEKQQQVHWMAAEVPLGEDIKNWAIDLSTQEKNLLTQIFRFFTQSDVEVSNNYNTRLMQTFRPTEIQMMLSAFANIETVHIQAYAVLLETIGMPEVEFQAFTKYAAMKDKHDYLASANMDSPREIARTLALFGAFTEGLQLFASFAMLLNFPRRNKMKGMGQIVTWSVRDESLHCEGMIRLYHTFCAEQGLTGDAWLAEEIQTMAQEVVTLEDAFIDLAFELGPVEGMTAQDIKNYIRYICDWRLKQLHLKPVFGISEHPLPWLTFMLNGVEHANFFEQRATEYSKNATTGNWEDTWDVFDKRAHPDKVVVNKEDIGPVSVIEQRHSTVAVTEKIRIDPLREVLQGNVVVGNISQQVANNLYNSIRGLSL